jgi:hypothetical protein
MSLQVCSCAKVRGRGVDEGGHGMPYQRSQRPGSEQRSRPLQPVYITYSLSACQVSFGSMLVEVFF